MNFNIKILKKDERCGISSEQNHRGDDVRVAGERGQALAVLQIPNLDRVIGRAADELALVDELERVREARVARQREHAAGTLHMPHVDRLVP